MAGPGLLLALGLLTAAAATADPSAALRTQACDRLTVQVDDPAERALAETLAEVACDRLPALERLFQVRLPRVTVRVPVDLAGFRRLSGRQWFMGAALVGDQLVLQPARSLRKVEGLDALLAHELTHGLIRTRAGRNCPRWLDEGLAQELSGGPGEVEPLADAAALAKLEAHLAAPGVDRSAVLRHYAQARWLVRRLLTRVGMRALVDALAGICAAPDPLQFELGDKPLGSLLFPGPGPSGP